MDVSVVKRITMSFVIGGVIGGICQLLVFFWMAVLGASSPWAGPAMLVTLAVIGLVMHVIEATQRLCEHGEMGALMPVSGLVSTVAQFYEEGLKKGGRREGREKRHRHLRLRRRIRNRSDAALHVHRHLRAVREACIMLVLGSFLICGFSCALTQLVYEILHTKDVPTFFVFVLVVGALLVPLGADDALLGARPAGTVNTVLSVGLCICQDALAIAAGQSALPFIQTICVLLIVCALGLVAGAIHSKKAEK